MGGESLRARVVVNLAVLACVLTTTTKKVGKKCTPERILATPMPARCVYACPSESNTNTVCLLIN